MLYLATTNAGKRREFETLLAASGIVPRVFAEYVEPAETATTFAGNARIKALALSAQLRAAGIDGDVLADDSGLVVDALGGAPGIYSARYGRPGATWAERRAQIIAEVDASGAARSARFACALHAVAPDGVESASFGTVEGTIAQSERGEGGFSYDAIFWYPPQRRTFAELSEEEKNRISHRVVALDALMNERE